MYNYTMSRRIKWKKRPFFFNSLRIGHGSDMESLYYARTKVLNRVLLRYKVTVQLFLALWIAQAFWSLTGHVYCRAAGHIYYVTWDKTMAWSLNHLGQFRIYLRHATAHPRGFIVSALQRFQETMNRTAEYFPRNSTHSNIVKMLAAHLVCNI